MEDGVAALWKLFQHCGAGVRKGREKRLIFSLSCLEWSNTCKEHGKDLKGDLENGIAALKYAL